MKFEYLLLALEALRANKARTLLSMLGIIIGVSTVIIVVGIGLGSEEKIHEQYKNMSVETIMVMGMRGRDSVSSSRFKAEDVAVVLQQSQYIKTGVPIINGNGDVAYGKDSSSYSITGVSDGFFSAVNLNIEQGRFFTEEEMISKDKIVIIGYGIVEDYFNSNPASAVGETIKINNKNFEIIGTLAENGVSNRMMSYDDGVFIPFENAEKSTLGSQANLMAIFLANSVDVLEQGMEEIRTILRTEHKLKDTQEDDFRMFDAGSMVSSAQDSAKTMTILLTSVAAIVLLVSGIGIMNVMFVTVAERTKEIGVMKAVGAKQGSILLQFLLEAVLLSLFGGLIGVILGEIAIPFFNKLEDWYVIPSATGVIIAFSFSVTVGIFFGFYPALKASKLDPVDALRSE